MKTVFYFKQNWKNIFRIIFPAPVQTTKETVPNIYIGAVKPAGT